MIKYEMKKVFQSPLLLGLLLFFTSINVLLMADHIPSRGSVNVLSDIVGTYGEKATEETLHSMESDLQEGLVWSNSHVEGERYQSLNEALNDSDAPWKESIPQKRYEQLQILHLYSQTGSQADAFYRELDFTTFSSSVIQQHGLSGGAADTVRSQFKKIEGRKQEVAANDEHLAFFFHGLTFKMHTFLFKEIGLILLFEVMALVVLLSAYVSTYEFEQRTDLVVFSTKRGRKLMRDKLAASLCSAGIFAGGLTGLTLLVYFILFDYSQLWHSSFSNYFMRETPVPYISWWNLSFIEYVGLFVALVIAVQLIFSAISWLLSIWLKNSYLVYLAFAVVLGLFLWIPGLVPGHSPLIFAAQFSPFILMLNPHAWFTVNNPMTMFSYYELMTILSWGIGLGGLSLFRLHRFKYQAIS
ncbi:hypothetical protein SAMN05216353_11663 [Halobacillus alkaliphilus]|uniref:ABC-2 family transporter protein n=1 Tax=Halobacillus alkaliphilus TaxID=396056 RepID=A0A1I2N6P4_9BACI|nr:hypothetical protein [Halobacillus alkaliphilus]SFF97176.1 hypothetical protein SAMN05216353_11663 [Halobacillus alkaliphilus]